MALCHPEPLKMILLVAWKRKIIARILSSKSSNHFFISNSSSRSDSLISSL